MMASDQPDEQRTPWWGTYTVQKQTGGRWEIGPSTIWLYRNRNEWRLIWRSSTDRRNVDPLANRSHIELPLSKAQIDQVLESRDEALETSRYSFEQTEADICLQPALADRPVVTRPEHPIHIPTKETVTLYVSTPLWVRITLAESERQLREIPSHRMSDTWFGTSTTDGELCYATRTSGRLRLDRLPRRLHRAVTPVQIKNTARDSLNLERVQLPVTHLGLYKTPSDALWTQSVRMTRTSGSQGADIQIRPGAPSDAPQAELMQEPREAPKKGLFTSTFGTFGGFFGA